MNLYLFIDADKAAVYGTGAYLEELTFALKGSSINVHTVHLHSERKKFEVEKTDDAEKWYIPEVRSGNSSPNVLQEMDNYCLNVAYLLRIHIRDTEDLIFQFNCHRYPLLARELKMAFNCKTVAAVHNSGWMHEPRGYSIYRETDRVVALSVHMQRILENGFLPDPDRITVIPNGLRDSILIRENDKEELRRKWHITGREFIILFAGRLHPEKGLIYLIGAFRKVLEKHPESRLMIAGSGNYDMYLQESKDICTKITFTGLLERKELYELYSIAGIGVIPSFDEQCSYVAIEMMMHGMPLIAGTAEGLKEMVEDEITGLHVQLTGYSGSSEMDSSLLAEKILYLLQRPEERKRMGANARRRYEMEYSTERFRQNMLNFYGSLSGRKKAGKPATAEIRPIAIYLPQFYPIPENDEWWGKGFTEWTNAAKAKPLFKGHYQPHIPADLGFYDLRLAETREAQAAMAKEYGIYGFCYYHYWFCGRRLLERPFLEVFESGKPDFPFMLCWANENWTRVWDGQNRDVLIRQEYSTRDDINHIRYLLPFFKDKRYIKVDGKPVISIYRSGHLPNLKNTLKIWREEAAKENLELYICRFDSHGLVGEKFLVDGFDAAIDFSPFGTAFQAYLQGGHVFSNRLDYADYVNFIIKKFRYPSCKTYPGICPMWDNSARRKTDYFIFTGSTPELYEKWLSHIVDTFEPYSENENFLFINAWNEWAEGNHLEPCLKWGKKYLEKTKDVFSRKNCLNNSKNFLGSG